MSLYFQIKKMTPRFFSNSWSLAKNLQLSKDSDPRKVFFFKSHAGRLRRFKNLPEFGFEAPNFQLWQLEVSTVEEVRLWF